METFVFLQRAQSDGDGFATNEPPNFDGIIYAVQFGERVAVGVFKGEMHDTFRESSFDV
jgi:hypothetical protein